MLKICWNQIGIQFGEYLNCDVSSTDSSSIRDVLRKNLERLVHGQYVERSPRPEPFIAPTSEEATASARRRSAKIS